MSKKRGPTASGYQASRGKYKCPVKDCKSEFRGDDISKHFAKYANLLVLDKAIEDLSNLRKNTKAEASDAIELSDEYIECSLSSFSDSEKMHTKYLIQHSYSSLKLPNYNSINFKCQQKSSITTSKSGALPSTFAKSGFSYSMHQLLIASQWWLLSHLPY